MTTTFTILICSAIALLALLYTKKRELESGRVKFVFGSERIDYPLRRFWSVLEEKLSFVLSYENFEYMIKRAVISAERGGMDIVHRLGSRFSVVGEIVTGRNIPRNRGSVSFFLKNIEASKRQDSAK